ncbi:MAG: NAD-dependent epimerase/dehydratase family protein [Candidatus Nitrosopumilus sp. bin_7KS]
MRILITGGAGFIGKYLVRYLFEKGHIVTIFDNFSNSTKDSISYLVELGVKVIEGDIRKSLDIQNAIKDQNIVIHLAAKISVSESIKNPTETLQVNVDGTRNVLVACEKNNVKKLIAASSAAVYGEGSSNVKLNEGSETNPISPYGESKVRMEQEIRDFESKHDIDCIILRFFNIYGIGQSPEYAGVITKFMKKIKQNEPLEIFGDGMQIRDFVAIDDVIYSIHNAILHGKSGTYNIASGKIVTIQELAELMVSISGKRLEIQHVTALKGDIRNSQADISLAEKELGYSPKFELDKIKELLE